MNIWSIFTRFSECTYIVEKQISEMFEVVRACKPWCCPLSVSVSKNTRDWNNNKIFELVIFFKIRFSEINENYAGLAGISELVRKVGGAKQRYL